MPAGNHITSFHQGILDPTPAQPACLFALTPAGLETVSASEMARLPGVTVIERAYRRITATCAGPLAPLLALRAVDDVFLHIATWSDIGRPRSALDRLRCLSARLDLFPALQQCRAVRCIPGAASGAGAWPRQAQPRREQPSSLPLVARADAPRFSVAVSFVGKHNYTTDEMKAILTEVIACRHGWAYEPDDRLADVHVRLFLDHEHGMVGLRLAKQPLHERWYRRVHVVGALKPSVAAAMTLLAEVDSQTRVLDPCCGCGTLLIETALQGALACGGDSDPAAVQAAQVNSRAAGVDVSIQQWQAQALPQADASIDRVVTNLPWGRQTRLDAPLVTFSRDVFAEVRRVLAPGGRVVVLTSAPEAIGPLGWRCAARFEISLFGQRPTILVLS